MGGGCACKNDLPLQRDTVCAAKTLKRAVQLNFIQQTQKNEFCYSCSVSHFKDREGTENDRMNQDRRMTQTRLEANHLNEHLTTMSKNFVC